MKDTLENFVHHLSVVVNDHVPFYTVARDIKAIAEALKDGSATAPVTAGGKELLRILMEAKASG